MGYRGDDLDLRTPQVAASDFTISQPGEPFVVTHRPRTAASRTAPIWVDETLLEICNHAFDVAAAHRAPEVRLEHLVYALTRDAAGSDALETRGARVANLRREAATVIATEIPAVSGNGKSSPHRAEIVEDALRAAAAHAYRRQEPAGIQDLLYALFDSGLEYSTLLRHLPQPTPRPTADFDVDSFRERGRNGPANTQATYGAPADFAVTAQQHSRIDALEHALRTLTLELANERKILSGVLQDLQRELMAQREDTTRLGGITQDKFQSVFGDRLHSLEQAFLSGKAPNGDYGVLQERLGLVERALQGEISATRTAVETLTEKPDLDLAPLLLRLDTIETAAGAERDRTRSAEQTLTDGLKALSELVERQAGEITTQVATPLLDQLGAANAARDTQHAATADALTETQRRLNALEDAFSVFVTRTETAATRAAEERAELRQLIERLADRNHDTITALAENLTQDFSEVHDSLTRVHSDHNALVSTIDTEAQDAANAFTALATRIESLEKAAAKPVEMLAALSTTVDKMHKVTVEKYYRRNRFWYWLFGTDDWLAASWPSQSARIAEELRAIKQ